VIDSVSWCGVAMAAPASSFGVRAREVPNEGRNRAETGPVSRQRRPPHIG
jgi:hypothetical protein